MHIAEGSRAQPHTAVGFEAHQLQGAAELLAAVQDLSQGRAKPLLPAEHTHRRSLAGAAALLAAGHPVAQTIHVPLLQSAGSAAFRPGDSFAVDQFDPQPRRQHQPAHLHLLHRQPSGKPCRELLGPEAQQLQGQLQLAFADHLIAAHLAAAQHLDLGGGAQNPTLAQQQPAQARGGTGQHHDAPEIAQTLPPALQAQFATALHTDRRALKRVCAAGLAHSSQRERAMSSSTQRRARSALAKGRSFC